MPDLAGSSGDGSKNSIDVKGDGNLGINQNFGNAFGNVGRDVVINQPQPKFLSLHQLPSDIADFTGRTTEIETIRQQLLDGKSLVISAVAGMAGVGKSALAIHVAQQLAESDYPDVQLYVDLRGADGDGLEPGEVLARWLRAFGLDESVMPIELQERASVYRSQLAGKRAIVLLDNAKDEAQVRPLLPGNGCAVIITSRRVLGALDGATVLNLKVLSDPEAWDLLAKLVGVERLEAEPEAAAETIRLCGGLPLAIRIVGGTLKQKLHWSLAEYCQKLTDEKQRLAHLELKDLAVRASFELSYRELSTADGMLFSRLGILVGKDFGAELAALVQGSEHPVIEGIERLIDAQLLEVNADRRYGFHDLLRLFAREKLAASTSVEEQEGIKQQIVNWAFEQSKLKNAFLDPVKRHQIVQQWIGNSEVNADFDEQSVSIFALAWFEQEQECLLGAIDWANKFEQWDIVVSFVSTLLTFLQTRSYWHSWEKTCLMAVNASKKTDNYQGEGVSLNNLGMVYRFLRRWDEAINCYECSLKIYRELKDLFGEGGSLNNLGVVYEAKRRWDKAIDCYQNSLTIFQALKDRQGESISLNNLGNVYNLQYQWDKAIESYLHSLTIKEELGDLHGQGKTINNLGMVYNSQSQWVQAIECYEYSLRIYQELGDLYGEGGSHNNLGMVYEAQHRWDEAIDCYERSLTICRKLGDLHGEGQSFNNLGNIYNLQHQWAEAIDCYQKDLAICRKLGDLHGEGKSLNNLGIVYQSQDRYDEAIELYKQNLSICGELLDRHGEGISLNNLALVYQAQSRWEEAIDCYHQSLTIKRELGDRHGEAQTLGNLGLLYQLQGQVNLAIPFWQEALSKLPEGAAEYPIMQGWLETARNPLTTASKQPILLLIIGAIVAILLLVNLISGR
jgi:tetratricopeptide (TPR) repeat protein